MVVASQGDLPLMVHCVLNIQHDHSLYF